MGPKVILFHLWKKSIIIYTVDLHFLSMYLFYLQSLFLYSRSACQNFLSIVESPFYSFNSAVYDLSCEFKLFIFYLKFSNILKLFQPTYIYIAIIHEIPDSFTALILDLVVSNYLKFSDDKSMLLLKVTISNLQCICG